jgi:hypothetical protein
VIMHSILLLSVLRGDSGSAWGSSEHEASGVNWPFYIASSTVRNENSITDLYVERELHGCQLSKILWNRNIV